ncbi:hypothetical protein RN001_009442 [Aquatica leii]|uniref:Sodium-coupled monocarboxylate transporter 1 n=1 Tax=Aquatica leii TaxID=1421715 RepID=A0AAN7P8S1_9COLE|nr:hypothetical protein RN001_009442 [Aquatica leii]
MSATNITTITTIQENFLFTWIDYSVFIGMLGLSGLIGVYFGFFGSKQNSTNDYLLGGKSMFVFPVAMSVISSNISGLAIMSVPADIYKYGAAYIWSFIPIIATSLCALYIYMPVFLKLELVSVFEYLQIRFDKKVKLLATIVYALQIIIYNSVAIYLPSLAFGQVSQFDTNVIAVTTCVLCIFYTAVGGLKAVVWTDTLQTLSIFVSLVVVFILGILQSGGFSSIIAVAKEGHRLDIFNFQLDPTLRDTFWSYAIGCTFLWIGDFAINQSTLQRLRAVPTKTHAAKVILIFCVGTLIIKAFVTFTGIMMYSRYANCDPLTTGQISHVDQVLPFFVMDIGRNVPGLSGIFVAGIFAAALSSLSTSLMNLATVIYTDFVSAFLSVPCRNATYILKLIVFLIGVVCVGLIFVIGNMGSILQVYVTLDGITSGILLGLFTLGVVFPSANKHGALYGGIVGFIFSFVMVFGNQWYKHKGLIPDNQAKPFSTEGCNYTQSLLPKIQDENLPSAFFRICFWYNSLIGTLAVVIVGVIVSFITRKKNDYLISSDLISPTFQFLLKNRYSK